MRSIYAYWDTRTSRGVAAVMLAATLAGCAGLGEPRGNDHEANSIPRGVADALAGQAILVSLEGFLGATPADQAELLESARLAADASPTTSNRLNYALRLGAPGIPTGDAVAARRQLAELMAHPEALLSSEKALATLMLASLDERLLLRTDMQQADEAATARNRDKVTALQRRLQLDTEENAKLKRALDDAQKKLDALTELERSITGHPSPPTP